MESSTSEKKRFSLVDAFMRWSLFDDLHRKRAKKFPIVLPPRIEQFYKPKASTLTTSMTGDIKTTNAMLDIATAAAADVSTPNDNTAEAENNCCGETSIVVQGNTHISNPVNEVNATEANRELPTQNLCSCAYEQRPYVNETTNPQEQLHGDVVSFRIKDASERTALRRRRREQLRMQNNHPQAPVIVRISRKDWPLCTEGTTLVKYMRHVIAYRIYVSRHPSFVVPTGIVKQTEDALTILTQSSNNFDAKMSINQINGKNKDNAKVKSSLRNNLTTSITTNTSNKNRTGSTAEMKTVAPESTKNTLTKISKSSGAKMTDDNTNKNTENKNNNSTKNGKCSIISDNNANILAHDDNITKNKQCCLEQKNTKQKHSFTNHVQTVFHYIAKRCVRYRKKGKPSNIRFANSKSKVQKLSKNSNEHLQEGQEEHQQKKEKQQKYCKFNVCNGDGKTHLWLDATLEHTEVLHSVEEVVDNNPTRYHRNQEKQKEQLNKEEAIRRRAASTAAVSVCYAQAPVTYEEIRQHPQLLTRERRAARWRHLGPQRVASEIIYGVPTMYSQEQETSSQTSSFCVKDDSMNNSTVNNSICMLNHSDSSSNNNNNNEDDNDNDVTANRNTERGDTFSQLSNSHQIVTHSDDHSSKKVIDNNVNSDSNVSSNENHIIIKRENLNTEEDVNIININQCNTEHNQYLKNNANEDSNDVDNKIENNNSKNSTIACTSLQLKTNSFNCKEEISHWEDDGAVANVISCHDQRKAERDETTSSSSSSTSFYHTITSLHQNALAECDPSSHLNESSGNEVSITTTINSTLTEIAEDIFPMEIHPCRLWHADPHKSLLIFNCDVHSNYLNNSIINNNSNNNDDRSSTNNIIVSDNSMSSGSVNRRKNNELNNTLLVSSHKKDSDNAEKGNLFVEEQTNKLSMIASDKGNSKPNHHFVKSKIEESTNDSGNTKTHNADSAKSMNASPLA